MALPKSLDRYLRTFAKLPFPIPLGKIIELRAARHSIKAQSQTIAKLKTELAHPALITQIAHGMNMDQAIVDYVRKATDIDEMVLARSFVQALSVDPDYKEIGSVGFGVLLAQLNLLESANHYFLEGGTSKAIELAPYEYFDSAFYVDADKGFKELEAHLAKHRNELPVQTKMGLLKVLAKYLHVGLLRKEVELLIADKEAVASLNDEDNQLLTWFNTQLHHDDPPTSKPETINIGVMDYKLLDRSKTSRNRGDYVQTLAALSNLVRFRSVEYVGDTKLSNYLNKLKKEIHADRQIVSHKAKVQPVAIDRDFSSGREYPENTWLISNGWFMHRNFRGPVDFPYPKNVLPLMISFHIQDPDVLTDETVAELKRIEPIGCRDWTTLYRLRDFGIKAFFSGCVTTTVGQVLPKATNTTEKKLALVETKLDQKKYEGWQVDKYIQIGEFVRDIDLVDGIEDARVMLSAYADYQRVATSRLHCYLPARSMGLPVDFSPKNLADVRFEGLINLDEADFNKIRHGIENKLEVTLKAILEGKNEKDVRALWAEICQEEVEFAEKYATTYSEVTESKIDVPKAVAALTSSKINVGINPRGAKAIEVAFALDQNLEKMIPVVVQSLVDHTDREINAHVMTRGLGDVFRARMGKLFPEVNFSFYNFDDVSYGDSLNLLAHISVSTMDRLFLPEILKDLDKIVYLDTDILIQGDVGYLFDLELGSNVFAAKRSKSKDWANMIKPITRATLHFDYEKAWDIRKRLHDKSDLTSRTFNAGILTLNLRVMREENFTATHMYLVEQCRMNDQDVFNIYSQNRVVDLDSPWNHVPSHDFNIEPKIIHWAGPSKPWKREYVLLKERFEATKAKVESRL
jgi:lipopolysaccharide biosynthesis glycosyltransferase